MGWPHPTAGSGRGSLEDVVHLIIMILIKTTNLQWFFHTPWLSADQAVLGTVARLNPQVAVGPRLAFAAKPQ